MSTIKQALGPGAAPEDVGSYGAQEIAHYRVRVGDVWLHAVRCGTEQEVAAHLRDADPVWTRPGVELLATRAMFDWFGPFPKAGTTKHWLVEVEA